MSIEKLKKKLKKIISVSLSLLLYAWVLPLSAFGLKECN